jgi:hypothetical protein
VKFQKNKEVQEKDKKKKKRYYKTIKDHKKE